MYLTTFCFDIILVPVFSLIGGYPLGPGPNPARPGGLSTKDCVIVPGFEHALCYAFIQDNGGPPIDVLVNFFHISDTVHFMHNLQCIMLHVFHIYYCRFLLRQM